MITIERYTVIDISDKQHMLRFEYVSKTVNVRIVGPFADEEDCELLVDLDVWTYVDEPTDIINVEIDCVDYFTDYVINVAQREKEEQ